ncbi:MAG: Holliday junction resolvase RuvX [Candidatus Nanopelagicales bacterium]
MRPGVRLAVDVGSVRIGVARSDPTGTLAVPERTLDARKAWLDDLLDIVTEYEPIEILVGLPVSLDGREHAAAERVRVVTGRIAEMVAVPVRLVDERMTTSVAHTQLRNAGMTTRKGRAVVDQAAAVVMLQGALETERATGQAPGVRVDENG